MDDSSYRDETDRDPIEGTQRCRSVCGIDGLSPLSRKPYVRISGGNVFWLLPPGDTTYLVDQNDAVIRGTGIERVSERTHHSEFVAIPSDGTPYRPYPVV